MNFDEILSQWEKKNKSRRKEESTEKKKDDSPEKMDSWLELYPPDRKMAERKEKPDRIITHTRKKQLNRMEPQATLDLHGWKGEEALKELDSFLKKSKHRGLKKVMIVHGKGLHSPGGESVLRPLVKQYLEESPIVRDYGRAPAQSGGSGATWILLR